MELRHLRYFVAIAEEMNFNRAAKNLLIAQPALSNRIADLEREIGVQLLDRSKRQIELTEAGKIFLAKARQLLNEADRAVKLAQKAALGEIGQIRIGFSPGALYTEALPLVLKTFRRHYPQVELVLQETFTIQQIIALHQEQLDVGFMLPSPPPRSEQLSSMLVLEESQVVVLPEIHPLAGSSKLSLVQLKSENWIWYPREFNPAFYERHMAFFDKAGYRPKIVQEATQAHIMVSLVACEIGISIQNASVQNIGRKGVVFVPLDKEDWEKSELYLVWKERKLSTVLDNFLSTVKTLDETRLLK